MTLKQEASSLHQVPSTLLEVQSLWLPTAAAAANPTTVAAETEVTPATKIKKSNKPLLDNRWGGLVLGAPRSLKALLAIGAPPRPICARALTLAKIIPCKRASLAYTACKPMVFYETEVFTARIVEFIDDESYSALQAVLVADPEAGDLIPKTRGLRKIRWMGSGRGKRGGIRVIYYLVCQDEIFMLYAYPKNRESDLSQRHLQMLRELVEQHLEQ